MDINPRSRTHAIARGASHLEENTIGEHKKNALSKRSMLGFESTDGYPTGKEVIDQPIGHPSGKNSAETEIEQISNKASAATSNLCVQYYQQSQAQIQCFVQQ